MGEKIRIVKYITMVYLCTNIIVIYLDVIKKTCTINLNPLNDQYIA